jgi:hypothetical protein
MKNPPAGRDFSNCLGEHLEINEEWSAQLGATPVRGTPFRGAEILPWQEVVKE